MKKLLLNFIYFYTLVNTPGIYAAEDTAKDSPATATFAGGCFWCMEPPFDKLNGVLSTTSGYTDGQKINPGYKEVSAGGTGHTEAIQIKYDPSIISYKKLLTVFWKNIDPTTKDAQFCDHGSQYRSGIYYHNEAQRKAAEASLKVLQQDKPFKQAIVTELDRASTFYPAEEYHQDYYQKNPIRYKYYRYSCGRDQRLEQLWREKR
ncbi:MAG: peptide-methionine (S)-S-oxide reductase MsrA [Gammaproteobacteria bacterium]|nr:peptide-methionine (S)-S-oxide reductase MsrA [Gammaproteobacteria bacterium]